MRNIKLKSKKHTGDAKLYRSTVREKILIKGTGIHSGGSAELTVHPAESEKGLTFRIGGSKKHIAVSPENVVDTIQAVTLGNGSDMAQTVEHLLAALFVSGITDAVLELNGSELPIMDGSAMPFYQAIQSAGITHFSEKINPIVISKPLCVSEGDKYLVLLPSEERKITYSIDYDHPMLRSQSLTVDLDSSNLADEILPARTFGFQRDIETMKDKGLIKGASLENAVCLTDDGYMNESLRFKDECLRHKILDLLGDLYLLNRPIQARILAYKAGHKIDAAMAQKINRLKL